MSPSADINLQIKTLREEEDIVKKVKSLQRVIHDNDLKIKDVAQIMQVKDSYVCHLLRLNKLPEVVVDGYYSKSISLSHLFIISRLKNQKQMVDLYEQVLANSLTIKKTEELVREVLYEIKSIGDYIGREEKDKIVQDLKAKRKNLYISLIQTRIKTKLVVEMKGSLENTGSLLRSLIKHLESWNV